MCCCIAYALPYSVFPFFYIAGLSRPDLRAICRCQPLACHTSVLCQQQSGCARAGYETTASALAFTVHCLAANPDKCERLLQARTLDAHDYLRPVGRTAVVVCARSAGQGIERV